MRYSAALSTGMAATSSGHLPLHQKLSARREVAWALVLISDFPPILEMAPHLDSSDRTMSCGTTACAHEPPPPAEERRRRGEGTERGDTLWHAPSWQARK